MIGCDSVNRYYALSTYFQKKYGKKYIKLSLDGGFSCPNRDGKLSHKGCIFCSGEGSGDFSGIVEKGQKVISDSLQNQAESQKQLLKTKWSNAHFIGYFQNYTNTYKPLEELGQIYDAALAIEGIEGIAISTRPDCILEAHIKLFKSKSVMWVELGLQTIHDARASWLRRYYDTDDFLFAYNRLKAADIPVVVHLILGIPGESKTDFLKTIDFMNTVKPFGIKLHMLNVLKGTDLGILYEDKPFDLLSESVYIDWVCDALEILDPEIVIHRLTGDGPKDLLLAPRWVLNKRSVLNGINKCLVTRNSYQGMRFNKDPKTEKVD